MGNSISKVDNFNAARTDEVIPVGDVFSKFVNLSGDTMTGDLTLPESGFLNFAGAGGTILGNIITIVGDLVVQGDTISLSAEQVTTQDNILKLNDGEVGAGVTFLSAGIVIDRGALINYQFIFDEVSDTFKVGELSGLQVVATREDTPTDNGLAYFDTATSMFKTDGPTWDGSLLTVDGYLTVGDATETALADVIRFAHADNDWRIRISAIGNIVIRDETAGTSPFRIDLGSPTNTLRIQPTVVSVLNDLTVEGHVGMGTPAISGANLQVLADDNSSNCRIESCVPNNQNTVAYLFAGEGTDGLFGGSLAYVDNGSTIRLMRHDNNVDGVAFMTTGRATGDVTFAESVTVNGSIICTTTTGTLRIPSMTTTQRNALTPVNGDMVYDTTLNDQFNYLNGGWNAWGAA